jgi:hypothetical protein
MIFQLSPLKLEKIKHGFKTLAVSGGIRGVDDTSNFCYVIGLFSFCLKIFRILSSDPLGQFHLNFAKSIFESELILFKLRTKPFYKRK